MRPAPVNKEGHYGEECARAGREELSELGERATELFAMRLAWLVLLGGRVLGSSVELVGTAPDERGLCDEWVWPPSSTVFCESNEECTGLADSGAPLECGGCMPSSCSCDPVTGGPLICTRDCLSFCHADEGARRLGEICCQALTLECVWCNFKQGWPSWCR